MILEYVYMTGFLYIVEVWIGNWVVETFLQQNLYAEKSGMTMEAFMKSMLPFGSKMD